MRDTIQAVTSCSGQALARSPNLIGLGKSPSATLRYISDRERPVRALTWGSLSSVRPESGSMEVWDIRALPAMPGNRPGYGWTACRSRIGAGIATELLSRGLSCSVAPLGGNRGQVSAQGGDGCAGVLAREHFSDGTFRQFGIPAVLLDGIFDEFLLGGPY